MKRMQKIVASLVVLLCAFTFSSCNKEKYQRNNAAGEAWLARHTQGARASIAGQWVSADWGNAALSQNGRRVTGTLGNYSVEGVVSGYKAYLLLKSNGWVYYTAELESFSAGSLVGLYSASVPFSAADQQGILLRR